MHLGISTQTISQSKSSIFVFLGSDLALGRYLEEIHVTWAQFWKELDKITTWLEDGLKNQDQSVETASRKLVTPSEVHSDDIWKFVTPSESAFIKEALETIAWRRRLD
ncbi:hypothetical protein Tco_0321236 [Tanacetum coccineum]